MIIFINGSINSGKTTIARILKERVPRTAHVEGLRQFIDWMSTEESTPFNVKNITSLIKNFSEGGLNVVVSYPISESDFHKVKREIEDLDPDVYAFTLRPRLEVAIKNRGERQLTKEEVAQIRRAYEQGVQDSTYGIEIDNSEETPEETAQRILGTLGL